MERVLLFSVRKNLYNKNRRTCGTTAWWIAADDSRKSKTSKVETEPVVVIFAQKLSVNFAHTVNCSWPLNGDIWRGISWRIGAKRSDRRWNEYS